MSIDNIDVIIVCETATVTINSTAVNDVRRSVLSTTRAGYTRLTINDPWYIAMSLSYTVEITDARGFLFACKTILADKCYIFQEHRDFQGHW